MEDDRYSNEMESAMNKYKSEWDKKKSKTLSFKRSNT